jgi:hypothetical protein
MKLAVYGDSFADLQTNHADQLGLDHLAWPSLLKNNYDQVDNFALQGSSLYYSMSNFEATHHIYDRVIFVVTVVGRWPGVLFANGMDRPTSIPQLSTAEWLKKRMKDPQVFPNISNQDRQRFLTTIAATATWFMDSQVMPFETYVHELMLDRIRAQRPDAVIVPVHASVSGIQGVGLGDFAFKAVQWFKPEIKQAAQLWSDLYVNWEEHRMPCHLTEETNQIVYKQMLGALELGKWDPKLPEQIVHSNPWEHYYRPRC